MSDAQSLAEWRLTTDHKSVSFPALQAGWQQLGTWHTLSCARLQGLLTCQEQQSLQLLQQLQAYGFFVPALRWHLLLPFSAVFTKVFLQLENRNYVTSSSDAKTLCVIFPYRVESSVSFA